MVRIWVTIARGQRTGCVIVCDRSFERQNAGQNDAYAGRKYRALRARTREVESQRCRENWWPAYASQNKENSTTSIKARSRLSISAAIYTCHSFGQEVCPGTISEQYHRKLCFAKSSPLIDQSNHLSFLQSLH